MASGSQAHRYSPRSANILLLHVYGPQSIVLALFSIIAGARLWLVKPDAIKFAKRYLLTYLGAHIACLEFYG